MDADLRNSARTTRARENIELERIDIDIDIGDEFYKNLFLPFQKIHLERVFLKKYVYNLNINRV